SLYHAAAGRWPRLEATTGGLLAPVPPLASLVPELPADLAAIIDRAVALEPAHRPRASELADALAGAGLAPSATPPAASVSLASSAPAPGHEATLPIDSTLGTSPGMSPGAPIRWRPWAVGLGALLALGLVAGRCGGGS